MNSASASSASISSHKREGPTREYARGKALTRAAAGCGEGHRVRRGASRESRAEIAAKLSAGFSGRSEEHTSELQSRSDLVCRLLLEKKKQYAAQQATRRARSI